MENKILELLKDDKSYTIMEINDLLEYKTVEELKELTSVLRKMEQEETIRMSKRERYLKTQYIKGTFSSTKSNNFGFVRVEGMDDFFIPGPFMQDALDGDTVIIERIESKKGNDARIHKILDRKIDDSALVGEYFIQKDKKGNELGYVKLKNKKYNNVDVIIYPSDSKGAMTGHIVLVKVYGDVKDDMASGEITKILGHKNDVGVDIKSIIYEYDINDVFSEEVMSEAEIIPDKVNSNDLVGRIDLRDEIIVTIDGDDAMDFDDAISIDKLPNGNYKLGVHISDVSYYVKDNTAIGTEAYSRGTSVYLVDRVIPMLPQKLSNGICSLNPNVDRLTLTCEMEIDENGKVINYDIYESIINSKKRMTYNNVNKVLNNESVEGYDDFVSMLNDMRELSSIIRKSKIKRGYLDFDTDEMKILVDKEGVPTEITLRERGISENTIEDFMIIANETVSGHLTNMDLPCIYRIHETPDIDKIEQFKNLVAMLGYNIKGKIKEDMHPKDIQKILDQLRDTDKYKILAADLLRCMKKAVYSVENVGHFGLASKEYSHFTSPIRRLPDLILHRIIRDFCFNGNINDEAISKWFNYLPNACLHSSDKERKAIDCEREVEAMKSAEWMESHIGDKYVGMISGVQKYGVFVELPNLIEGLIKVEDLNDDVYELDEENRRLIGKNSKKIYMLGDKVEVVVVDASKDDRTIDFVLSSYKGLSEYVEDGRNRVQGRIEERNKTKVKVL